MFKDGETKDSIRQTIANLEKQVKDKKIELGLELSDEAKKTLEMQKENAKKLEKANEEFNKLNTTYDDKPSSYDSAIKKAEQDNGIVPTNQDKLDAIREEMDYNDELIAQLEELRAEKEDREALLIWFHVCVCGHYAVGIPADCRHQRCALLCSTHLH